MISFPKNEDDLHNSEEVTSLITETTVGPRNIVSDQRFHPKNNKRRLSSSSQYFQKKYWCWIGAIVALLLGVYTHREKWREKSLLLQPSLADLPPVEEVNPGVGPIAPALTPLHIPPFISAKKNAPPTYITDDIEMIASKSDWHTTMRKNLQKAQDRFIHKLMVDYGKHYCTTIFLENSRTGTYSRGRTILQPAQNTMELSWKRLKRNVMIKLLQVQTRSTSPTSSPVRFVWATGGDSRAAGHGNFYNQSYTAVLERSMVDVWKSVGIDFVSRNYAMGATQSAPEIAFCIEEIFGTDVDVLLWDYGMTDARRVEKLALYLYRAGLHPNRPVVVANGLGRRYFAARKQVLEVFEDLGVPVLYVSEHIIERALAGVPDSYWLPARKLDQLPEFVKNLRCQQYIEYGLVEDDRSCVVEKFNVSVCETRPYRTSWHPGWKRNAILGNLMGLSLVEILQEALDDLIQSEKDPSKLLQQLQMEQAKDSDVFASTEIPAMLKTAYDQTNMDVVQLVQKKNYCHTARLPAEIRFKGILSKSRDEAPNSFFKGHSMKAVEESPAENDEMRLVYSEDERQDCNVTLNVDFNDFFYTSSASGEGSVLILPNDEELKEYGQIKDIQGILAICFAQCLYNKCPRGNLDQESFDENLFKMSVNGWKVTNMTKLGGECELLQHAGGSQFSPNGQGKFELRVQVTESKSFVRLGSVLLW